WDGFETPAFELQTGISNISEFGPTQATNYDDSPGSIYMAWNKDNEIPTATAAISSETARNWASYAYIRGKIYTEVPNVPLNLSFNDGFANISTAVAVIPNANQWNDVIWPIPRVDGFDLTNVTGIEIEVSNLDALPSGALFVDQLELGRAIDVPYGVEAQKSQETHLIRWNNPLNGQASQIQVRMGVNDFPAAEGQGAVVCDLPASGLSGFCEIPTVDPSQTYYYVIEAIDAEGNRSSSDYSRTVVKPSAYEITDQSSGLTLEFDQENGSLMTMKGGPIPTEINLNGPLWHISFIDSNAEGNLTHLHAAQFDDNSETFQFSISPDANQLSYLYTENDKTLEIIATVTPIDGQGFDLRLDINNQTGQAIRKVSLAKIGFPKEGLEQVLIPAYEGIALLPQFFEENRQTTWSRPHLFADLLYVDSSGSDLALMVAQNGTVSAPIADSPDNVAESGFQPVSISLGSYNNSGVVQIEFLSTIPSGTVWQSPTTKLYANANQGTLYASYLNENQLAGTPPLFAKAVEFGHYDSMASSPLINLDFVTLVEQGLPTEGGAWRAIQQNLIDFLPQPAMVQFSNWQTDANNGQLANLPAAQPIAFEQLGPVKEMQALLGAVNSTGRLSMPVLDITVWNELDPDTGALPDPNALPGIARSSRAEIPISAEGGYVVKPWHPDVQARNSQILEQYTNEFPQELLFVEMAGQEELQFTYSDGNNSVPSTSIYIDSLIAETARLGGQKPLILNTLFDRYGQSAVGMSGSLKDQNAVAMLEHLGDEYVQWVSYPIAAGLMHSHVGFYPDAFEGSALPTDSTELFTYYTTYGYNLATDADIMTVDQVFWLKTLEVFQTSVNSQTFGKELADVRYLDEEKTVVETVWGSGFDLMSITANFDPNAQSKLVDVGDYRIAPNGFYARSSRQDIVAGIFAEQFNGVELSDGVHWIVADYDPQQITVYQPQGSTTFIGVDRPAYWRADDQIRIEQILVDGRALEVDPTELSNDKVIFEYRTEAGEVSTDRVVITYGRPKDISYRLLTLEELAEFFGSVESEPETGSVEGETEATEEGSVEEKSETDTAETP
ncbi:MAG: hypothetical protein AAF633_22250, partial [Chloroflexota bacterium]